MNDLMLPLAHQYLSFAVVLLSVVVQGQEPTTAISTCPIFVCAAPPSGCTYRPPFAADANGCATNCGTLTCEEPVDPCPIPGCLPPPEGCTYGTPEINADGCQIGCGPVVCCPVFRCDAPPIGCTYSAAPLDDDGCAIDCGTLECEDQRNEDVGCFLFACVPFFWQMLASWWTGLWT